MPSGRCAACGRSGTAARIALHILDCAEYHELFRTAPALCLSPAAAAEQHRLHDTPERRATARDQRLRHRFAALEQEVAVQSHRWRTPPDLLDS